LKDITVIRQIRRLFYKDNIKIELGENLNKEQLKDKTQLIFYKFEVKKPI